MRRLLALLGLGGVALLASSCGLLSGSSATPAQPVIVTNNIPSGSDGGTTVLLAVVGIATFILLAVAIVAGMAWANEKRRRTAAEDTVAVLMGRPTAGQIALAMAPPISAERLQALAAQLPEVRGELQR